MLQANYSIRKYFVNLYTLTLKTIFMVSLMYEIMHVNSYGDEDAIAKHYQLNIQEFLGILVHVLMVCPFQ